MKDIIFDLKNIGMCYRKTASLPWKSTGFWALHDISLTIRFGETIGIIGRNGAGKTTLLKIIAGIIMPDTGTIYSADITTTMLSLGAGFDDRLTGRQNIFLNGLLLGMDKNQVSGRVDQIIELAEVGQFIDEPVKNYSKGMRARLGFSIAHNVDTDAILIDEALAVGDQAFKDKTSKLIKEKIKSDRTVVLVSHNMRQIKELCDRIIQIENGFALEELPVEDSIERYLKTQKKD
ncbi:MAG: ABC transporter ATP-binding protein [Sedimentisphaerales bacterium]|nr:ABC transporter ATP-binding protein [Sedimentisphaerales bacterium]